MEFQISDIGESIGPGTTAIAAQRIMFELLSLYQVGGRQITGAHGFVDVVHMVSEAPWKMHLQKKNVPLGGPDRHLYCTLDSVSNGNERTNANTAPMHDKF
jgi:hypothetical protein